MTLAVQCDLVRTHTATDSLRWLLFDSVGMPFLIRGAGAAAAAAGTAAAEPRAGNVVASYSRTAVRLPKQMQAP